MPPWVDPVVVGSRASLSVLFRMPWLDPASVASTGASVSLMAQAMAPGLEHTIGQAAQAFSASSWGCRNPQGSPAEPSYSPTTARDHATPDVLQLVQPTVILPQVALQEHESTPQAS